jgi:hypothetical protein
MRTVASLLLKHFALLGEDHDLRLADSKFDLVVNSLLNCMTCDAFELSHTVAQVTAPQRQSISSMNDTDSTSGCFSARYGNIALIDRMNSTGAAGEPCGRPACMSCVFPVLPSTTSIARLSDRNELIRRTMLPVIPTSIIRWSSCRLFTKLKASLISSSSVKTICFRSQASSIKVTNFATASDVLRPWRQLNWPLWNIPLVSQYDANHVAATFSTTLPRQPSKLMTRYARVI